VCSILATVGREIGSTVSRCNRIATTPRGQIVEII